MASMAAAAATMGLGLGMGGMTVTSHFSPSSRLLSFQPNNLIIPQHKRRTTCSISINHKTTTLINNESNNVLLSGSTRTVTTLFATALLCVKAFVNILPPPDLCASIATSSASLCFAVMKNTRSGTVNTPLTVVAAGLKKWLDIYSGVLLVRVLLSWFPNIPWERQPLSAIRDLCDPYLSLFRNIVPPVFDTLDISPLLAFAVLGSLAGLLTVSV